MEFITEWVTNIILFVLLATVIDMLLPNSSMRKYTKMVMGLLLIAIILTPIFKIISNDFESAMASITFQQQQPEERNMKNSIDLKKKEIQAVEHAYILEEMAVQLKKDVKEELMEQYGLEIANIEVEMNTQSNQATLENLQKVMVLLTQPEAGVKTVEAIKPIVINTETPLPSQKSTEVAQKIAAFLSQKWDLTEEIVDVSIEGGLKKRMDNHKGPFSWLKKQLKSDDSTDKKPRKYQYMILVLLIGAAFMIVGNIFFKPYTNSSAVPASTNEKAAKEVEVFGQKKSRGNKTISEYEERYESQLKNALEEMLGVNDVTVIVNMDSTDRKVLEKNTNTKSQTTEEGDRDGGQRKVQEVSTDQQLVIIRNGEKEVPIVIETKKPDVRGVLVVAKGAENIEVKKWIKEAVTRVLGVPSYRVSVMPKK